MEAQQGMDEKIVQRRVLMSATDGHEPGQRHSGKEQGVALVQPERLAVDVVQPQEEGDDCQHEGKGKRIAASGDGPGGHRTASSRLTG